MILMKKPQPTARMALKSFARNADMAKLEANAARACNLLKAMANPTLVFLTDRNDLDELFTLLVQLRHEVALNAGFTNFRD